MTRDQLFKLIAENTNAFMREQVLRDAVDDYTETLLKQCNVMSRFSRDELIQIINEVVESKQTLGAEDIADAIIAAEL